MHARKGGLKCVCTLCKCHVSPQFINCLHFFYNAVSTMTTNVDIETSTTEMEEEIGKGCGKVILKFVTIAWCVLHLIPT